MITSDPFPTPGPDLRSGGREYVEDIQRINDRRNLGSSDLEVTSVGLGVWAWGDTRFWTYGEDFDRADIDATWRRALDAGVNLIDTAEIYGHGASETIVGELLAETREELVIATKFYPERDSPEAVRRSAEASLTRLGIDVIDLYQVHW